jgi:hypothetical protein
MGKRMTFILQMSDSTLRPNTGCCGCTWFLYEKYRESDEYGHNHFLLLILPEEIADDLGSFYAGESRAYLVSDQQPMYCS